MSDINSRNPQLEHIASLLRTRPRKERAKYLTDSEPLCAIFDKNRKIETDEDLLEMANLTEEEE